MMKAKKRFQIGNGEEQKKIVRLLGSNRVLSDRNLLISANKWGGYFEMIAKPYVDDFATLELNKISLNTKQNKALTSLCCGLRGVRGAIRTEMRMLFLIWAYNFKLIKFIKKLKKLL
ncbi:MAG: hypothetical protein EOM88_04495 [Clostridia bacterium]|nr:hypothetical protein [Clostridia bacterium]